MDAITPKTEIKSGLWRFVARIWQELTCEHDWVDADPHGQEQNCKKCPAFRSIHGI